MTVRSSAVRALGDFGDRAGPAVPAVAEALGSLGPTARPTAETLRKLSSADPEEAVRTAAGEALRKLGGMPKAE